MSKLKPVTDKNGALVGYSFYCPGCEYRHVFYVHQPYKNKDGRELVWQFSGDMDKPSFTPSLVELTGSFAEPTFIDPPEIPPTRCHLVMTNGVINFCGDCTHALASQAVEVPNSDE